MAKDSVVIIDYGSGNLRSAAKSFEYVVREDGLDMAVKVSSDPADLKAAARIILPGQGAFGDCMNGLSAIPGMIETLEQRVLNDAVPFLGICVGMQLLADEGLEHGRHKGLGWIGGRVVKMTPDDPALKIPHMGWNVLTARPGPDGQPHFVLRNAKASEHYYFVHSFMFESKDERHILGVANYGGTVTAVVGRDNIVGVQFHPEKSQQAGLKLISDFLHWRA